MVVRVFLKIPNAGKANAIPIPKKTKPATRMIQASPGEWIAIGRTRWIATPAMYRSMYTHGTGMRLMGLN
jgi:hypothetical protein